MTLKSFVATKRLHVSWSIESESGVCEWQQTIFVCPVLQVDIFVCSCSVTYLSTNVVILTSTKCAMVFFNDLPSYQFVEMKRPLKLSFFFNFYCSLLYLKAIFIRITKLNILSFRISEYFRIFFNILRQLYILTKKAILKIRNAFHQQIA